MSTYVSLLRGINVGGKNKVPMAQLKEVYTDLGLAHATTYIQSGNVVFIADGSAEDLASRIEDAISAEFGLSARVIVRTRRDLERVVAANPLRDVDTSKLHVAFLDGKPTAAAVKHLGEFDAGDEECKVVDRHVYLHYPSGAGRVRLPLERRLGVAATVRNWRTVNKLIELAAGLDER